MAKVFVGKCPQCDSNVYQEEGQEIARCYFCGSVVSAKPKAAAPVKIVTRETEAVRKQKTAAKNNKIAIALIVMLGGLFVGLAVMIGVIGVTYAQQNLEARNSNTGYTTGGSFLNEGEEPYTGADVEVPEGYKDKIETIMDEETPMADAPQYGELTENECRAVEEAKGYLEISSFSRKVIMEFLSEGDSPRYTALEASNALDYMEVNGYVDWYSEAMKTGSDFLDIYAYSRDELISLLMDESIGFTYKEAEFAADALGLK